MSGSPGKESPLRVVTQLAMFVRNAPGTLADICAYLGEHEINLLGISVQDGVDHAVLRVIPDKPKAAAYLLEERGLLVVDAEVLSVEIRNLPGRLAALGHVLREAGINIHYVYGGLVPGGDSGMLYLRVDDPDRAAKAIERAAGTGS